MISEPGQEDAFFGCTVATSDDEDVCGRSQAMLPRPRWVRMGTLPAATIAPYGDLRQKVGHIVMGNPQFNPRGGRYHSPSEVEPTHGTGRTGARSMSHPATPAMTLEPRPSDGPEAPHESALDPALDAALAAATLASGSPAVVGTMVGQRVDQIRYASSVDREVVKALCRHVAGTSDGPFGLAQDGRTAGWVGFHYAIGEGSSAFVAVAADGLDELSTVRLDAIALDVARAAVRRAVGLPRPRCVATHASWCKPSSESEP